MNSGEVQALAEGLLTNAASLVADAQLLCSAGRFPRVYSLSVLALEELGKIGVLMGVSAALLAAQPVDWKAIHAILHSHQAKLLVYTATLQAWAVVWRGQAFDPASVDWPLELKRARALNTLKQDGLYVRLHKGTAITPTEEIDEGRASRVLEVASRLLPITELMIRGAEVVRAKPDATKENSVVIRLTHPLGLSDS